MMFSGLKLSAERMIERIREQAHEAILSELVEVATYHKIQETLAQAEEDLVALNAEIGESFPTFEQRRRQERLQQIRDIFANVPAPHLTYLSALWQATGAPPSSGFRVLGEEFCR